LLWDEVIRLAERGHVQLSPMVTHRFPLEESQRALAVAADVTQSVKVMFHP
jgi:threonine dehydrogenase-like Zn-dependent dehydrogenase